MKKTIYIMLLLLISMLMLVGCDSIIEDDENVEKGSIVMTLSRNIVNETEETNYSGFTTESMTTLSEEDNDWPRSVEDVQEVLEGYRVRIKGENVDVFKNAFFEEGEDEVTIEVSVPARDDYTVELIALGGEEEDTDGDGIKDKKPNNLLGAGKTTGIIVEPEENAFITVEMEPYKYNFKSSDQVEKGETIEIIYELKGPLLSDIWGSWIYLYYSMDEPQEDKFGERITQGLNDKEIINDNHWQIKFDIPGQSTSGLIYYQIYSYPDSEWSGEDEAELITPSIFFNEEIPTVEIGEADSSMVIEPEW